jgi:ABC-type phosphate transport system auxiliary subunit
MTGHRRASDRWITPGVVMVALVMGTIAVLGIVGMVGYLTARGYDPAPIVTLTANLTAAAGALGSVVLQLVARKTQTRIEQHTGLLPAKVDEVATKVEEALWVDVHADPLPPVPPPTNRLTAPHPFGPGKT